jgi:poly-gamma-glutamate synthase PgsB/CapB
MLSLWALSAEHVPDARLFAITAAALAVCVIWLAVAAWRHRRNVRAIPVRIHVAGTRGKSTTTRLIAAGLRAGGRRVMAKTTGTEPRLIGLDGSEAPWRRRGRASVREQMRFFAVAARAGADTAVVECMAIRPELGAASEDHLVRATTCVITNARPDHFEEIGERRDAAADAVRWAIPRNGRLFVGAEASTPALLAFAAARGTEVTVVDTADRSAFAPDRALALAVCEAHGVAAAIAGPAMDDAAADPGAFFARILALDGKTVRFANAFACNDVASLALLWTAVEDAGTPVVLLNARRDRPLRTRRFLDFLAERTPAPLLFVVGDPLAMRLAHRAGLKGDAVRRLRGRTAAVALAELAERATSGGVIWGIGNYRGFGARLVAQVNGMPASGAERTGTNPTGTTC